MELTFKKAGMLTTVQDEGRSGNQQYGVPSGGAMDRTAHWIANWLVGNPVGAPVFEITMIGPEIKVDAPCCIAITGADMTPAVNGEEVPLFETIYVEEGSIISFGTLKNGCRAYLAVGGKWEVEKWLGSASTVLNAKELIIPSSIIRKGDTIKIEPAQSLPKKKFNADLLKRNNKKVRVLPGPEFHLFSKEPIGAFFSHSFKVSPQSNRMGYRLDFNFKEENIPGIISSGIVPGTVQITSAGQPIILMADAQTTGGYPRFVNVISADMDFLAQIKPGDEIAFQLVNYELARDAYTQRQSILNKIQ